MFETAFYINLYLGHLNKLSSGPRDRLWSIEFVICWQSLNLQVALMLLTAC